MLWQCGSGLSAATDFRGSWHRPLGRLPLMAANAAVPYALMRIGIST